MRTRTRVIGGVFAASLALGGLTACGDDDDTTPGEQLDEGIEDTGEGIEDTGEELQEETDDG